MASSTEVAGGREEEEAREEMPALSSKNECVA
jgi:hypothetical protein